MDRARKGEGPSLIECKTYRWRGHFEGDPVNYRTEEELQEWKKKDPVKLFHDRLISSGVMDTAKAEEIEESVKKELDEAIRFADESPQPDVAIALEDVYGD